MADESKAGSRRPTPEAPTQLRHSVAYDLIGSVDTVLGHVSGTVRLVGYERPDAQRAEVREALLRKKLILGEVLTYPNEKSQAFRVPKSARPIAYDASVGGAGAFSYNDENLFYDLGNLLGELFVATEEQTVARGDIGRIIAFVEFTEPDERRLFFVPGIERVTVPLETGVSPLGYYADKLTEAFGNRFDNANLYFRTGFAQATATGEV